MTTENLNGLVSFATQACNWKAIVSVVALALMGLPGWAGAAGGDKVVPVKLAANAPGMIKFDSCARPTYPAQEFKQNHQGMVTLRFLLGADGKVKESLIVASSGYPALDEAALVAISKCSFNPPMADGKPVDAWIHFQYDWKTQ
jgi:D-alanyl-D-alanine endopeptidase (penicillin-binding protein 7)